MPISMRVAGASRLVTARLPRWRSRPNRLVIAPQKHKSANLRVEMSFLHPTACSSLQFQQSVKKGTIAL